MLSPQSLPEQVLLPIRIRAEAELNACREDLQAQMHLLEVRGRLLQEYIGGVNKMDECEINSLALPLVATQVQQLEQLKESRLKVQEEHAQREFGRMNLVEKKEVLFQEFKTLLDCINLQLGALSEKDVNEYQKQIGFLDVFLISSPELGELGLKIQELLAAIKELKFSIVLRVLNDISQLIAGSIRRMQPIADQQGMLTADDVIPAWIAILIKFGFGEINEVHMESMLFFFEISSGIESEEQRCVIISLISALTFICNFKKSIEFLVKCGFRMPDNILAMSNLISSQFVKSVLEVSDPGAKVMKFMARLNSLETSIVEANQKMLMDDLIHNAIRTVMRETQVEQINLNEIKYKWADELKLDGFLFDRVKLSISCPGVESVRYSQICDVLVNKLTPLLGAYHVSVDLCAIGLEVPTVMPATVVSKSTELGGLLHRRILKLMGSSGTVSSDVGSAAPSPIIKQSRTPPPLPPPSRDVELPLPPIASAAPGSVVADLHADALLQHLLPVRSPPPPPPPRFLGEPPAYRASSMTDALFWKEAPPNAMGSNLQQRPSMQPEPRASDEIQKTG